MKFIKFIVLLLASFSIFVFISTFNVKLLFSSSNTAKSLLNESNLYPIAAAGIRDNIVKFTEAPVDQEDLIEAVNNVITDRDVKFFVEDFIDQFYAIVKSQTGEKRITLHFAPMGDKIKSEISKNKELAQAAGVKDVLSDREVDLSGNPFVLTLIHIDDYLIGFGIAAIVFLLLLLFSGAWSQKLIWLGVSLIIPGIVFVGELAIYYFGISQGVLENLSKETKLEDARFLMGVQKLISSILDYQKTYYLIVAVILVVLGVLFIAIGRLFKKHDVGMEKI